MYMYQETALHCTFSLHGPFFARTGSVQGQAISALHGFSRNGQLATIHGLARTRDTCVPSCTEVHGLDGEPPLARNCTENKPNKGTAQQSSPHAKQTNNTLVQRRSQFL